MTLVERIRNAIMLKAEEFDADDLCCMGAPTSQHGRNVATALARAAIEAMREPTEAMEKAGADVHTARQSCATDYGFEADPGEMGSIYRAMLAAALEEKP